MSTEFWAWVLMYLNLMIFFAAFRTGNKPGFDPMTIQRIVLVLVAGILIIRVFLQRSNAKKQLFSGGMALMTLFALVAIISSTYATAPFFAAWKAVEISIDIMVVATILGLRPQLPYVNRLYNLTLLLIGITALSPWLGVLFNPSFMFVPEKGLIPFRIQGYLPLMNSNTVGSLSAITSLIALIRFLNNSPKRTLFGILFAIAFFTLILSTSRTALIGFTLAFISYSAMAKKGKLFVIVAALVIVAVSLQSAHEFATAWFQKEQAESTLSTLSGRTVAWEGAMELFYTSPIFGNGFASASRFDLLEHSNASTLHGAVFDVLVGVGVAGFVPWLLSIIWVGWKLWRHPYRHNLSDAPAYFLQIRAELIAVYVFLIIRATTSSGLSYHEKEFMIFLPLLAFASVRNWHCSPIADSQPDIDAPASNMSKKRILKRKKTSSNIVNHKSR